MNWMELLNKKKPQINAAFKVAKKELKNHRLFNMQDEFGEAYLFTDLIDCDGWGPQQKQDEIDSLLEAILCNALLAYESKEVNDG